MLFKVTEVIGIKFPDHKASGATTRSSRMRLPANVGQKKTKAIEQKLKELDVGEYYNTKKTYFLSHH